MARIRERRPGVWEVTVWAPLDPLTGKRRQVSRTVHGGRRMAERLAAKLTVEVDVGRHTARHTLGELLEEYLRHQEARGRAPETLLEARRIVREVAEALGSKDLAKLKAFDLDQYYAGLARRGLSPTTRHHHHSLIRAALNQAIRWGRLFDRIRPEPPRPRRWLPRSGSLPRRQKPGAWPRRSWTPTRTSPLSSSAAAATGMRRGELCGLRWRDLDLVSGQVTVNQRVSDLPGGMMILPGSKTKKKRRLALDPVTVTILAEQHVRASERCEALGVELVSDAYVWSQDADHRVPWRPHRVTDAFRAVSRAEGLGTVRLQDLRHFSATQMLGAGVDPRTAAGRLGHDASVLLRIYGHVIPARDREAAEILGQLMAGGGGDQEASEGACEYATRLRGFAAHRSRATPT